MTTNRNADQSNTNHSFDQTMVSEVMANVGTSVFFFSILGKLTGPDAWYTSVSSMTLE